MADNKATKKFKVSNLEAKLGVTLELQGKWVRVDRGITLQNLFMNEELMMKEITEAFDTAEKILADEIVKATKGKK